MNLSHLKVGETPVGHRKLLHIGDEARVFRLGAMADPILKNLVERRMPVRSRSEVKGGSHQSRFLCFQDDFPSFRIYADSLLHGYFSFSALKLAKEFLPENFPAMKAYRVYKEGSNLYFCSYSDFIRDESGAPERTAANRKQFNLLPESEKYKFRDEMDLRERKLNPDIEIISNKAREFGLVLAHPEANYRVENGRTVFFEVIGIDPENVWVAIKHIGDPDKGQRATRLLVECSVSILGWKCDGLMADITEGRFELSEGSKPGLLFAENGTYLNFVSWLWETPFPVIIDTMMRTMNEANFKYANPFGSFSQEDFRSFFKHRTFMQAVSRMTGITPSK